MMTKWQRIEKQRKDTTRFLKKCEVASGREWSGSVFRMLQSGRRRDGTAVQRMHTQRVFHRGGEGVKVAIIIGVTALAAGITFLIVAYEVGKDMCQYRTCSSGQGRRRG